MLVDELLELLAEVPADTFSLPPESLLPESFLLPESMLPEPLESPLPLLLAAVSVLEPLRESVR